MPAHVALICHPKTQNIFWILISIMIMALIAGLASTLVNPNHATEIGKVTSDLDPDNSPDGDRADLALVPGLIPHANLGAGAIGWTTSRMIKEVGKQAIDQPGHFLIGAAPIWASRCLVGVPWFGWVAAPILAYREWLQWPSNRWWDPPLDWAFLTLGAVAATWGRRRGHGFAVGFAALRRRMASGLPFPGRLPQRA